MQEGGKTLSRSLDIRGIPAEIRAAAIEDARKHNAGVNDLVVEILAARYGVPHEPSGYPFAGTVTDTDHWNLRMPDALLAVVRAHAKSARATMTAVVLNTLAHHYGLPPLPMKRRSYKPGLDPRLVAEADERNREGVSVRMLAREYKVPRETLTKAIRARRGEGARR